MKKRRFIYNNNEQGFTILEVLLVALMIGILASSFAPYWIESQIDRRILNKVTTEIQSRLDAARLYYVQYGSFPTSLSQLKTAGYLPASVTDNTPFGSTYQYVATANSFTIRVPNVPSRLRQQLASTFPNAVINSGTVQTTVVPPGTEPITDALRTEFDQKLQDALKALNIHDITYIGINNSGSTIYKPTCPPGKNPYIFVTPVSGNANGYPLIGFSSYAYNYWNRWVIYGVTKGTNGTSLLTYTNRSKLLTMVVCW